MPDRPGLLTVLDTHVWIWVVEGHADALSRSAINAIEEAGSGGAVRVSAISVWEAAMLEAKGRISLSRPIDDWGAGRDPCDSEILEYSEGGHLSALNSRI